MGILNWLRPDPAITFARQLGKHFEVADNATSIGESVERLVELERRITQFHETHGPEEFEQAVRVWYKRTGHNRAIARSGGFRGPLAWAVSAVRGTGHDPKGLILFGQALDRIFAPAPPEPEPAIRADVIPEIVDMVWPFDNQEALRSLGELTDHSPDQAGWKVLELTMFAFRFGVRVARGDSESATAQEVIEDVTARIDALIRASNLPPRPQGWLSRCHERYSSVDLSSSGSGSERFEEVKSDVGRIFAEALGSDRDKVRRVGGVLFDRVTLSVVAWVADPEELEQFS